MKIKFITIKKNTIIALLLCLICIGAFCGVYFPIKATSSPKPICTIALDAGHGGRDGGCVGGQTKVKESDLALAITKKLKKNLQAYGFNVVLTRKDENGLYKKAKNKKLEDMQMRKKIINDCKADCVISIHMNSFTDASARGAQAFHAENDASKTLSKEIQNQLVLQIPESKKEPLFGDYYILKCTQAPSVLVECGYLSNPEEEALLITNAHQEKLAYAIFCGILKFFNYSYA